MTDRLHEGMVTEAVGGFYAVMVESESVVCRARGRLRRDGGPILAGDRVLIARIGEAEGVIEKRLPRTTVLKRPPVANVDLCMGVQSTTDPDPVWDLIDRIAVHSHHVGLAFALCVTKVDLVASATVEKMTAPYKQAGYPVFAVNALTGEGIDAVLAFLAGHITTMAGPSGVGKSTLLNAVCPGWNLETGDVSAKIGRGRHTTRQVRLLPIPEGGWVADTPGFSTLELTSLSGTDVAAAYPEIARVGKGCRFRGCLHRGEPDCAVIAEVGRSIHEARMQRYLALLSEVLTGRAW